MAEVNHIQIEVAYALPDEQVILVVEVAEGTTIEQAINVSGILEKYSDIDLSKQKVGLFGKLKKMDHVLRASDRIEIYRPLIADPKEVRKQRAAQGKQMKKGGGDLGPAVKKAD
jgi:putative ubiquitin-RnfH superfamily antitoxin RatB of RatAB toxin-antitoxin module